MIICVINLDHKQDRLTRMAGLLEERGLAWQRIAAVNGRLLDDATQDLWSARHAAGSRILSPGEIGCVLSHRDAWQRIAASGRAGVVLEDDVHLAASAAQLLASDAWLPADADLVKIETTGKPVDVARRLQKAIGGHHLARLAGPHLGTAGYILTPKAALRLLERVTSCDRALDHLMFDPAAPLFHELVTYQLLPALCIQDQFLPKASRIGLDGEIERAWAINRKKLSLGGKLAREMSRLSHQLTSSIAGARFNPFSRVRRLRIGLPPQTT